jgi:integrase
MKAKNTNGLAKWEYPEKSGIWIREFIYSKNYNGEERIYSAYQVTVPGDVMGKKYNRKRKQCSTKDEAEQYADDQAKGLDLLGKDFFEFSGKECRDFATCMEKLKDTGIMLTDAVDFAIEHMKPAKGEQPLSDVIQELQESKLKRHENGDLSFHSLKDFRYRSGRLNKDFGGKLVHEISSEQIREWAAGIEGTNRTRMNHLRIASEIFRYAEQKRYLTVNPFKYISKTDRYEIHGRLDSGSDVTCLTLEQAERLISCTATDFPEMLGVITLGLFCGIRTEELKQLTWAKVDLTRDIVAIGKAIAKKRRIRHVTLPDNAKQWLTCIPQRTGNVAPVSGKVFDRLFSKLLAKAGFVDAEGHSTWPRNSLRSSFGSHHYEAFGDAAKTIKELGHKTGDDLLFNNYRALVKQGDGLKYFSITPASAANKVVEFAG